jgi:hypothetical protein
VKAPAIQIEQLREWQQQQPVYFQWSERELKLLMEYLKPGDVIVPKFAHPVTNTPELETGHATVVWTFNAIALVLPRLPEREWRTLTLAARRPTLYREQWPGAPQYAVAALWKNRMRGCAPTSIRQTLLEKRAKRRSSASCVMSV